MQHFNLRWPWAGAALVAAMLGVGPPLIPQAGPLEIGGLLAASIFGVLITLLFGWMLKQSLVTRVVLDAQEITYSDGAMKRTAKYTEIEEVLLRRASGFDAADVQRLFLVLSHPTPNRDEESFSGFSQWLGVKEPDRTLTMDLSQFDRKTAVAVLSALSELAPQAKMNPPLEAVLAEKGD